MDTATHPDLFYRTVCHHSDDALVLPMRQGALSAHNTQPNRKGWCVAFCEQKAMADCVNHGPNLSDCNGRRILVRTKPI